MNATMEPNKGLSAEQREFFFKEGYLVVNNVLSDADLHPVTEELTQEITRRATELVQAGRLSSTYETFGFERQLARISAEDDKIARSIWNGALSGPAIFHLISHPRLLDLAEALCGPELIASSVYRLRPKLPHYTYGAVPWHQDSGYFDPYCDKSLILTVWLALVDATEERGCLHVMPRVHEGEILRHRMTSDGWYLEIPEEALPEGLPVLPCPVGKGGVLLMSNRTPHVSYENRSDVVRWSMDLRYQSAALPTNAAITRTPEEAAALTGAQVPIACYPPEADFLVRSRRRPEEVLKDPVAFNRMRKAHQSEPMKNRWADAATDWERIAENVVAAETK